MSLMVALWPRVQPLLILLLMAAHFIRKSVFGSVQLGNGGGRCDAKVWLVDLVHTFPSLIYIVRVLCINWKVFNSLV